MTSQVCTRWNGSKWKSAFSLQHLSVNEWKQRKGVIAQTPGLLSCLFHFLPWPHLLLFLSLLSHSFDDSSSCQCLPCPITGHWLRASWPSPRPSLSFSKPVFQPSSFSFPFNGWTGIKKLSGTLRLSWQKRGESVQESCPCLLLQTTCSFTQKTLREKPQTAHYQLCLFRRKQACQCLILKMSQEDFLLIRNCQMLLSDCYAYTCMYITACMLGLWWHMLSPSAALKLKAKCWKPWRYMCYSFKWSSPKNYVFSVKHSWQKPPVGFRRVSEKFVAWFFAGNGSCCQLGFEQTSLLLWKIY